MIELCLHGGNVSWGKISEWPLKLIQIGTDSKYFHVGIRYNHRLIIESTSKRGVDIRPLSHYEEIVKKEGRIIDIYGCVVPIDEPKFFDWLVDQNDRKYDMNSILRLAWLKLSVQRKKANDYQKNNDYFCSELAMTGLRRFALNQDSFYDLPACVVTSPADITRSKSFKKIGSLNYE